MSEEYTQLRFDFAAFDAAMAAALIENERIMAQITQPEETE